MRNILLKAARSHAQGHVDKHVGNIEIYLNQKIFMDDNIVPNKLVYNYLSYKAVRIVNIHAFDHNFKL